MKKALAMIVMVVLILTMGLMAQAETRMHTAPWSEDGHCKVDKDGTEHYYVLVYRDHCGYAVTREVSRTVYYELLAEEQADEQSHNEIWYVQAWNWTCTAATDVADFVVFWN